MQYYYYVNAKNKKDGPHDLITIMRRIYSGIIIPDTLMYQGEELVPAYRVADLSSFFNRPVENIRNELIKKFQISISNTLKKGWQFTLEHQSMPVLAGAVLLLSALFGILVQEILHKTMSGITAGWIMFLFLQSCFFAVSLRLYRGQKTDLDFIEYTIAPIMGKLSCISVLFSIIIIIGLPLLVVPGIIAMLVCAYMPMFILDYNLNITRTISSIFSLLRKLDKISMLKLSFLILFYMVGIAMIFPIPLIMPVIAGSLCSIYEELSTN